MGTAYNRACLAPALRASVQILASLGLQIRSVVTPSPSVRDMV